MLEKMEGSSPHSDYGSISGDDVGVTSNTIRIEERGEREGFQEEDKTTFILGLTRYQFLVLFSSWLGWGFDIFDSFLFTYAAPLCIPSLLKINNDDTSMKEREELVVLWTAILTSVLLVGWGIGGVLFGITTDRLGR
jgi:hypothetical protein